MLWPYPDSLQSVAFFCGYFCDVVGLFLLHCLSTMCASFLIFPASAESVDPQHQNWGLSFRLLFGLLLAPAGSQENLQSTPHHWFFTLFLPWHFVCSCGLLISCFGKDIPFTLPPAHCLSHESGCHWWSGGCLAAHSWLTPYISFCCSVLLFCLTSVFAQSC